MNLSQLHEIIDEALENEINLSFICNKDEAMVITDYLMDYDLKPNLYYTLQGKECYFNETLISIVGEEYAFYVEDARDVMGNLKTHECDELYAFGSYGFDELSVITVSDCKCIYPERLIITQEDLNVYMSNMEDYEGYEEDCEDDETPCMCGGTCCSNEGEEVMCCPDCGEVIDPKNVKIHVYDWDEIEEMNLPETEMMALSMIEHFVNEVFQTQGDIEKILKVVNESAEIFGGIGMLKMERKIKGVDL
jgi:hypothetical protein